MSNVQYDIWYETTIENLQATNKFDCYRHEEHYIKDCGGCEEAMDNLKEAIEVEKEKLE